MNKQLSADEWNCFCDGDDGNGLLSHEEALRATKNENVSIDSGKAKKDPEINPIHYRAGEIECIAAIESATHTLDGFEGYCIGCAIKYLWRYSMKGGVIDLRKARWYVNRVIKRFGEE